MYFFLDLLKEKTGVNVTGLNIKEGYEHYSSINKFTDKIIFYDGINFPFKEMNLI